MTLTATRSVVDVKDLHRRHSRLLGKTEKVVISKLFSPVCPEDLSYLHQAYKPMGFEEFARFYGAMKEPQKSNFLEKLLPSLPEKS